MVCEIPRQNLFQRSIYERILDALDLVHRHKFQSVEVSIDEHGEETKLIFPVYLVKYFEPLLVSKIQATNMILRMFVTEVEDGYSAKKKSILTAINQYPGMTDSEKSKLIAYILKESA